MAKTRKRLGEMLIDAGLIDRSILEDTLVKHRDRNLKLGECLIQEGIITENKIVTAVARQLGIDRFKRTKYPPSPTLRKELDEDLAVKHKLAPVKSQGNLLWVAMLDPTDILALDNVSQQTGKEVEPVICNKAELSWLMSAIYGVEEEEGFTQRFKDISKDFGPAEQTGGVLPSLAPPVAGEEQGPPTVGRKHPQPAQPARPKAAQTEDTASAFLRDRTEGLIAAKTLNVFKKILAACIDQEGADFHISANHPVVLRKAGKIFIQKDIFWRGEDVEALADKLMNEQQREMLRTRKSVDFSLSVNKVFLRIHAAQMSRGLSFSFRLLPGRVPSVDALNLHPSINDFCDLNAGLVLVCGATGTGKTSTIAAMLDTINRTRAGHIITMEDPIEYRFKSLRSYVEQREYRVHFHSFEQGLQDVLRQMPDTIFVGELREPEVIRQTINVAESGHLVLATLHANSPEEAVYRICNSFPMESQDLVRYQLSATLAGVIVQRLTSMPNLGFRVPLLSVLRSNAAFRNSLRDNKLSQIDSLVEMGFSEGMFSFKRYMQDFLQKKNDFTPPSSWFSTTADSV